MFGPDFERVVKFAIGTVVVGAAAMGVIFGIAIGWWM